jgi:hypothetical protein
MFINATFRLTKNGSMAKMHLYLRPKLIGQILGFV